MSQSPPPSCWQKIVTLCENYIEPLATYFNPMKKTVLFIQGGGDDGYRADAVMVKLLKKVLGETYEVLYPEIASDENAQDFGWPLQIGQQVAALNVGSVVVAHSLGASMLLKYLSEHTVSIKAAGIFLLAAPFWSGNEAWKEGLKLKADFAKQLQESDRLVFYHCKDDQEVPSHHLDLYRQQLPGATFREFETGGHQFKDCIDAVSGDIKNVFL